MAVTQLGSKALMDIVKVKENGVAQDFYVVRHNAYTSGRTLLLRRYIHSERQWHSSNVNAYATCTLDAWFNGEYFNSLPADIRGQIAAVTIPYTPGNGSTGLSSISRKVFAVSATELGHTHSYLNAEGTALANAATLKIATDSGGTAKVQWTRSPNTSSTAHAWYANTVGSFGSGNCSSTSGARPAFTLPSTLSVDDDGNITVNTAPVINYSGNTSLGDKSEGFTVTYHITDADGDAVTVTEKMDGATKRTHCPTLGAYQQFQAVLPANFQTILNGAHTLLLEATDGKAAATPVSITFTKKVHSCSITLSAPLPATAMPTAVRLAILGNIPADAVWTAEVCNNAHDASPAWESIKSSIQAERNYIFQNKTNTAGSWGVNFRIAVQRGSADSGGYITGIEGGFK
ncbi:MAG: DUF6273 domain-containing protein [Oscillospiraceae bacterium]|nr:DUF6273 domain-containing protein [Oscillospiraceae bacterium]